MSIHRFVRLVGATVLALILMIGLFLGPAPTPLAAGASETQSPNRVTSIVPPPLAVTERLRLQGQALPSFHQLKASPSPVKPRTLQGSVNLLAILVDFSDNGATVTANLAAFDNLIFAPPVVGRGSVRDYFNAVSYGNVDLVTVNPLSSPGYGWQRAPGTYAYYVNGQYGLSGPYPNNAGGMVADVLPLVDPLVDFSNYDNDGDGAVDTLLVIHAGTGAEFSADVNHVWSHASAISLMGGSAYASADGVTVDRYVTVPEGLDFLTPGQVTTTSTDMTIGVPCHEIAHGIWGLPDLYDLDLSSNGIGQWGLMSYGDWNGPAKWDPYLGYSITDGSSPALPSAWSRIVAGFDTYYLAFGPTDSSCMVAAESLPGQIYRFKTTALAPQEYFLMENRQQMSGGYDQFLPGSGMIFWHVDEAMWSIYGGPDNNSECRSLPNPHCWGTCTTSHYLVSVEQADGFDHLEYGTNTGDTGDPFPGSTANTAWQWYWNNPRNPESGSWYGSSCFPDSCLDIYGIYVQPPFNVCFSIAQASCADAEADLGDAPASVNNYMPQPMTAYPADGPFPYVPAYFPTVFFYPPLISGPRHHFCQVDSWLGSSVTGELQADGGPDQDGVNNIDPPSDTPDRDSTSIGWGFDDALPWNIPLANCAQVSLPYTVTVGSTSIFPRYVNVWLDMNRDGDWGDTLTCPGSLPAPEWAVQDQVLNVGQGVYQMSSPAFLPRITIAEDAAFESWLRISIAEMPAPAPQDGRGPNIGYDLGETEDHHLGLFPTLLKTADLTGDPLPGELITYHIEYQADGNVVAQGVVISDVLSTGLQYVSSSPPGAHNPATRSVVWTTNLVPFQPQTLDLVVRVTGAPSDTITNTAYLLWGNAIWRRSAFDFQVGSFPFQVYLPLVLRNSP